ncbi:MAG: hypothetical protein D8M59_04440 [Planctomycetes bacterium]|nr:hypothetical protein [Planctomycetota bacterium]
MKAQAPSLLMQRCRAGRGAGRHLPTECNQARVGAPGTQQGARGNRWGRPARAGSAMAIAVIALMIGFVIHELRGIAGNQTEVVGGTNMNTSCPSGIAASVPARRKPPTGGNGNVDQDCADGSGHSKP